MKVPSYEAPPARKAGVKVGGRRGAGAEAPQRSEGDLMGVGRRLLRSSRERDPRGVAAGAHRGRAPCRADKGRRWSRCSSARASARPRRRPPGTRPRCSLTTIAKLGSKAPLAETFAPLLADAVKRAGASALIGTATSSGKDILPRVAALLDAGMVSDIIAVTGANEFRRPAYAGNAIEEVEVGGAVLVASVRQTEFPPPPRRRARPAPSRTRPPATSTRSAPSSWRCTRRESERPDLGEAKVVVSGGRGMKAGENFKILEQLADLLGGAMGASRAACDAGMVPNDLQVGQTGKVVAPKLYIAVAISGAIQHLAGMKGSKVIVAINKDPEAPIFQVADYGLVATWEKAIPALIAEIKKLKSAGVARAVRALPQRGPRALCRARREPRRSGWPFLLIHGAGASSAIWMMVMARLARAGRAVAIDLPGHGPSPRSSDERTSDDRRLLPGHG